MNLPRIVSPAEWQVARDQLLVKGKAVKARMDWEIPWYIPRPTISAPIAGSLMALA